MKFVAALVLFFLSPALAPPSEQDRFLAAIRANPADDTARLAYADYLDEHDQPERAAFIRYQVRAFRMRVEGGAERAELTKKANALLHKHEAEWLPQGLAEGLQKAHTRFEWERGFPIKLNLSESMLNNAEVVQALNQLPILPSVQLNLGGFWLRPDIFVEKSKALTVLRHVVHVELEGTFPSQLADILAAFPGARHVVLSFSGPLSVTDMNVLLGSPIMHRLESLTIHGSGAEDAALRTLVNSPNLPQLKSLVLPTESNVARMLAEGSGLPALEELFLGANSATNSELVRFFDSPLFSHIRSLSVWSRPRNAQMERFVISTLAQRNHSLSKLDFNGYRLLEMDNADLARKIKENQAKSAGTDCWRFVQGVSEFSGGVD